MDDTDTRLADAKDGLLAHVASKMLTGEDCEVVGFSGSGRCVEEAVALRWEDGFADLVCDEHAARAEGRGALVVRPERSA